VYLNKTSSFEEAVTKKTAVLRPQLQPRARPSHPQQEQGKQNTTTTITTTTTATTTTTTTQYLYVDNNSVGHHTTGIPHKNGNHTIDLAARRLNRARRTGAKLKARWRLLVESWSLSFS